MSVGTCVCLVGARLMLSASDRELNFVHSCAGDLQVAVHRILRGCRLACCQWTMLFTALFTFAVPVRGFSNYVYTRGKAYVCNPAMLGDN